MLLCSKLQLPFHYWAHLVYIVCIPRPSLVWSPSTFPVVFYPLTSLLSRAHYSIQDEPLTPCLVSPHCAFDYALPISPLKHLSSLPLLIQISLYPSELRSNGAFPILVQFLRHISKGLFPDLLTIYTWKFYLSYTHFVNSLIGTFKIILNQDIFEIWNVYIICVCIWMCICEYTHMCIHTQRHHGTMSIYLDNSISVVLRVRCII